VTKSFRRSRLLGTTMLAAALMTLVSGVSATGAQSVKGLPVVPQASWSKWGHFSSASSVQPHTGPARWVSPPQPHVTGATYTAESTNWSGQIASGTTFTGIAANWVVPSVQPTASLEGSATWVGIDGGPSSPSSIIQTGTTQATQGGTTGYYAWYELYPNPAVVLGSVSSGDQMQAAITQSSGTSWTLSIDDVTSGNAASGPLTYTGPGLSAEWIEELPTATSPPQPNLANFGSAQFTQLALGAVDPSAAVISPVDMVDGVGNVIASAGSISSQSFTITYVPEQTTTTVSASPTSSTLGSSVTYSATVSSAGPTPTGTVAFTDGSTPLCTATLSNGSGSCAATNTPQGNGIVHGQYSGDANSVASSGSTSVVIAALPQHGYWLVGSDGGIFTFGSSQFYGSIGSLTLQRPVVGIVPTADRGGYWLDASDGGVFSFGDTRFYGSIPGLGLHPAGTGLPNSLNAPIVGMVPSIDDGGYFMVGRDGGIFAFGDAHFAGSCPGIGGCAGAAVAVMPDHSGNGYWVVTSTGNVYTFGDAPYFGAPGHGTVTSAVATADGRGYWVLLSDGEVFGYGDGANLGSPSSANFNALNVAAAIFATSTGAGYWVSSALGAVFNYGDAPNDGGMSGRHLNGAIIAATGF
jgi:Peptidase A4 family/Bacterial Ig-like domain (group 3)